MIAIDDSIDQQTALGYRRMAYMKDMPCSLSVASLASAERPGILDCYGSILNDCATGWRVLESVGTFSTVGWLNMVNVGCGYGLRGLTIEHGGCFEVFYFEG